MDLKKFNPVLTWKFLLPVGVLFIIGGGGSIWRLVGIIMTVIGVIDLNKKLGKIL